MHYFIRPVSIVYRLSNKRLTHNIVEIINLRYFSMAQQIEDDQKFTGVRLPTTLKPVHYDLSLKPDLEKFTFDGTVKIAYTCSDVVSNIVLNSNQLKITDGSIEEESSKINPLTSVTYSRSTETATLDFKDPIASKGQLVLNFQGILNDQLKGFYRTSFKIGDSPIIAATTQFESTDARRCFPCWDEPAIKATFSVTITYSRWVMAGDKKYERIALSNMPEISRSGSDEALEVKFDKSPIMSTYLLAIIVGPFEAIEASDGRRPVRVYTIPGKKEQGRYSLEVACKALPYYEDYFGITYPLPKMDLIAIPDFQSGAMENWGLVTYRETCLLVDPNNTALNSKQVIALVVAHELAHQWFGNLVTMEWWTHLWLNEGFATFMEYLCVDHIFPDYDIWSQFLTDDYGSALALDALHNSHPIEVPVKHPNEIEEIFDTISYNKGASVIRMLYNFIGDDCFRRGMKDYLTKFAYKNAATEDLWDALEAASNKPVRRLMSGWTAQKGYPWLSVGYSVDGDNAKLTVTQNKFSADGVVHDDEAESSWMIPINAITGKQPNEAKQICLLEDKKSGISVGGVGSSWIKLNSGTIGLYRTAYPVEMLENLGPAIADQTLPAADRLGIQDDYFALCQAGNVGSVELLKLLQAYKMETNYVVWKSINCCVGRLSGLLANTDSQANLHAYGRDLFAKILGSLTWTARPNESHTDALARAMIIDRLVTFKDKNVLEEARTRFKKHLSNEEIIPADLRGACYKAVALLGEEADFDSLMNIYKTSDLAEERNRVARSFAYVRDPTRLQQVIDFAYSDEVRSQDKIYFLVPLSVNNPALGWEVFKKNGDKLRELYGTGHLLIHIIRHATENFADEETAQDITKYFEANKFPSASRTIKQSLETIRLNAKWLQRDGEAMKQFLSAY